MVTNLEIKCNKKCIHSSNLVEGCDNVYFVNLDTGVFYAKEKGTSNLFQCSETISKNQISPKFKLKQLKEDYHIL
jgi:hypothetical protein